MTEVFHGLQQMISCWLKNIFVALDNGDRLISLLLWKVPQFAFIWTFYGLWNHSCMLQVWNYHQSFCYSIQLLYIQSFAPICTLPEFIPMTFIGVHIHFDALLLISCTLFGLFLFSIVRKLNAHHTNLVCILNCWGMEVLEIKLSWSNTTQHQPEHHADPHHHTQPQDLKIYYLLFD